MTKVPGHVIFILREKVPYVHLQATVGGSEQYRIGGASYYATAPELEMGATGLDLYIKYKNFFDSVHKMLGFQMALTCHFLCLFL